MEGVLFTYLFRGILGAFVGHAREKLVQVGGFVGDLRQMHISAGIYTHREGFL